MAVNAGTVYAEADLNLDRFHAAVAQLEADGEAIVAAMKNCAAGVRDGRVELDLFAQGMDFAADAAADGAGRTSLALGGMLTRAVEDLAGGLSDSAAFLAAGESAARSFGSGMAGADAGAGAQAMVASALSAAGARASEAPAVGRSFASGLAAGILSGRSAVISAATQVAGAAAAAARSALSIHSPSKVTEEMGEFFDQGFIRGVEGMAPNVERSVRRALEVEPPAGAAFGAGRDATPTAQTRVPPIDYDALAEAMDRRQMVLTMDGRRVAQIQGRETARVQYDRNRRIALGYGK